MLSLPQSRYARQLPRQREPRKSRRTHQFTDVYNFGIYNKCKYFILFFLQILPIYSIFKLAY